MQITKSCGEVLRARSIEHSRRIGSRPWPASRGSASACWPRTWRGAGLVYDAVDVTRPPPARFSWRALYAATAAAAAADERSGAGRALEPGDFSFEREIGVGAFGQVVLATHKKTGTRYAVKTISKKVLRRKKIAQRIWRLERDVLVRIEPHPYIVPLLGSFQTLSHFFLVMAYLPGGELFETCGSAARSPRKSRASTRPRSRWPSSTATPPA